MGARGPAPKSFHLRVLEGGTLRTGSVSHRPRPKSAPKPVLVKSAKLPAFLSWMSPGAKAEWRRVAPALIDLRLLTEPDLRLLAAYCEEAARYERLTKRIAKLGPTFTTSTGYIQQRPEVSMARAALEAKLKLAAHFGMTPSARARIQVPLPEEPGTDDDFSF